MGNHPPSRPIVLLDSTSANSSTYTSSAHLAASYDQAQSISVETVTAAASRFTVQGTLADGLNEAIPAGAWSDVTTITQQGVYTVDPGLRFVRALRSALESLSTVVYFSQ